jgi:3-deoxy-manno-octulosonate cytidylyltransferase (CMP-KDO synthetase)
MKVLGVIPARFASSRFPGKPLIDIKGKTMIRRVFEGAAQSSLIERVVVATDDQRIMDEVLSFNGNVVMTSEKHPSGTDRCAEVAALYPDCDIVINIQGDEPLVDYRQLEQLISAFSDPSVEIATLVTRKTTMDDLQNPNRIKVVANHEMNALYFSRSVVPNFHHATSDVLKNYPFLRHIGLYAYRASTLQQLTSLAPTALEKTESLEQLRWLFYGYTIRLVETEIETPNIDVPEDLQKVLEQLG